MRRLLWATAWLASIAGTYALAARRPPPPAPAASVGRERPPSVAAGPSADVIRAIVREELSRQAAATTAAPAPEAPALEADPGPRPELVRAHAIVDAALARGRWTEEDRDQLRVVLGALSAEDGREVLALLVPALNAGRVHSEVDGPPL